MSHFKRWGAIWILVALFLGSWLGQFVTQFYEVMSDAHTHHEKFVWSDFMFQFGASTFENWQSEFLQLAVQAVLIASLVGQKRFFNADGSADKDDVDKILTAISELRREKRTP